MKKNDSTIKLRYDSHIKVCDNEQHGLILIVGNFYGMFCEANNDGYIPYLSECSEELVDNLMWLLVDNADAKHVFVGVKDNISEYVRNLRKCAEVLFGVNIKDENWIEYLVDSDDELLDCLNKVSEEMPKFDYIIQIPPNNKNLCLRILRNSYDLLNDDGILVSIQPDSWFKDKFLIYQQNMNRYRLEMRKFFEPHIRVYRPISGKEAKKYFNLSVPFEIAIFIIDKKCHKNNWNKINSSNDKLLCKVLKKISEFPSLRSKFIHRINDKNFVPVRRDSHDVYNFCAYNDKNNRCVEGILFASDKERINFISSFDTWLYKYLAVSDYHLSRNVAKNPYLNNYTEAWTDDRLYKLFDINSEEISKITLLIKNFTYKK